MNTDDDSKEKPIEELPGDSPKKKKNGWGGKRPGAGGPKRRDVGDADLLAIKLNYEKLLVSEGLPKAYKALKKILDTEDNPFASVKYIFDRVYGRPREADKLTGADEALRRELAIAEAKKRVDLLEEQIALARLQRKDKERKEGSGNTRRDEGRFYPSGGAGVGPCGKYHAALDAAVYPGSPFARPDIFERVSAGELCPICGDPRFVFDASLVSTAPGTPNDDDDLVDKELDDSDPGDELDEEGDDL